MTKEQARIKELEATIVNLNAQIKELTEMVDFFKKHVFGSSSEKTPKDELSNQLSIFNEAELEADPKAEEPGFTTVGEHARIKKSARKDKIIGDIPIEEVLIDIPDEFKHCEQCGTELKRMGTRFVREELQYIPAQLKILRYVEATYECPKCKHTDHPFIQEAEAPISLMNHSLASSSSVAWVMYQKYVNSIPLYRQEKEWENMGLILSRATMANWIIRCSEDYLDHLVKYFQKKMLDRHILHVDETPIQVLKEEGKTPQSKSYMWVYRTGNDGQEPIVIYDYQPSRNGDNAVNFLKGFKGYIHTDGFSGYNKLEGVTRCACLAHIRRKFVEACPDKKEDGEPKTVSEYGRNYCNILFEIERTLKDLSPEERYTKRLELEKPVLDEFWNWLDMQHPVGGGKLYRAIEYANNQKKYMENYLKDGRCSISNNIAENAIRPFTVGRKNWLFSDTPKGARASAACYSVIETAKANNLNVYKYLEYLLYFMPFGDWRGDEKEFEHLMPWSNEVKAACSK